MMKRMGLGPAIPVMIEVCKMVKKHCIQATQNCPGGRVNSRGCSDVQTVCVDGHKIKSKHLSKSVKAKK